MSNSMSNKKINPYCCKIYACRMKNRNLIILSICLFMLILSGATYIAYKDISDDVSDLRIYSIEPALVRK